MPKYYVTILPLRVVISADNPKEAAIKVIRNFGRGKLLSPYTEIGTKGFDDEYLLDTDQIMSELYYNQPSGV